MLRPIQAMGDILMRSGLINQTQLQLALSEQKASGEPLEDVVMRLGQATEEQLLATVARQFDLEYTEDPQSLIKPESLVRIPSEFALQRQVLPLYEENHTLVIAVADPLDVTVVDDLRLLTGLEIRALLASRRRISEAIQQCYMEKMFRDIDDLKTDDVSEEDLEIADLQKMARDAIVVRIVGLLIHQAVQERASDIHIEPHERQLKVRYRVDGRLNEVSSPPKHLHPAIVSRIKILSDMDIAERRLPQDGKMKMMVAKRAIDMRVSTVPTVYGESVAIRILDRSQGLLPLPDLGMRADTLSTFRRLIHQPHGIILVTGPTGSGKTTTLYAALNEIYSPEHKVITIEEPVEYELPGCIQINVRTEIGLTFASGLRHIVRQDPDIIMVGEIRDPETAEIAIQAALTGHLVLSTLHTNDAPGALTRLLDMGVEPFLAASSIVGVLAQRLIRVICPNCKVSFTLEPEALRELGISPEAANGQLGWRGEGCAQCNGKGYRSRTGIYEILPITDVVRQQVLDRVSSTTIKQVALQHGMRTLLADGQEKVLDGTTTVEELLGACQRDEV